MYKRTLYLGVILTGLALCFMVLGLAVGSVALPIRQILSTLFGSQKDAVTAMILDLRFNRLILAFIVGGGLAIGGAVLQGVFANPLGDAHLLGVSSGAGLGVTMLLAISATASQALIMPVAFMGGILTLGIVWLLARVKGRISTVGLLLSGIAVSSIFSAFMSVFLLLDRTRLDRVLLWLMGSVSGRDWSQIFWATPVILAGSIACWVLARPLNILLLGSSSASSMGIHPERVRLLAVLGAVLCTATAVSVSGVIGFVGLLVPHGVRLLCGPDYRRLIPISFLAGGCFLMLADIFARTLIPSIELPIGALTALAGGPFFLVLLRRKPLH